jgi:hypothetical protein
MAAGKKYAYENICWWSNGRVEGQQSWGKAMLTLQPLLHHPPDIGCTERLAEVRHVSIVQKYPGL